MSLPTNNHRQQPGQVCTREGLNKVCSPGLFERRGRRGLPSAGAPFQGAPQYSLASWIANSCTVVCRAQKPKDEKSFTKKQSEDRFPTGNSARAIHKSRLRSGNCPLLTSNVFSTSLQLGSRHCLGVLYSSVSHTSARRLRRQINLRTGRGGCPRMFSPVDALLKKASGAFYRETVMESELVPFQNTTHSAGSILNFY